MSYWNKYKVKALCCIINETRDTSPYLRECVYSGLAIYPVDSAFFLDYGLNDEIKILYKLSEKMQSISAMFLCN